MTNRYRIVEEVPGVPAHERYFVTGPLFLLGVDAPVPQFATLDEARDFLVSMGVADFDVEPFES